MRVLATLFFVLMLQQSVAQEVDTAAQKPGKVILIGVVHMTTDRICADSLLSILKQLEADVVLIEYDSLSASFSATNQLAEPPAWYKEKRKQQFFRSLPPEIRAVYLYQNVRKDVIVLPFDRFMPDRNAYIKAYNRFDQDLHSTVRKTAENTVFSPYRRGVHERLVRLGNTFSSVYQMGYYGINQQVVTDSIRVMVQVEREHYPALMDSLASLRSFKEGYFASARDWTDRNTVMANNILRFTAGYPGKTIVVLTGLFHKYYLQDLLRPQQARVGFVLKDL
jgi:hypothetical protein